MQKNAHMNTLNKRQRIPKGQSKMDNPEKLPTQSKKNKNKKQNVLDTTIYKQTQITPKKHQTTEGKDEPNIVFMQKIVTYLVNLGMYQSYSAIKYNKMELCLLGKKVFHFSMK